MPTRWIAITAGLALMGNCQADELRFVTEDFPPFTYASATATEDRAAGPFVEIVAAVCARLRIDCPVQLLPWRRALALAEDGEAQGIFTVIRSPDRERAFHLTRMLVTSRYGVYARSASRFVFHRPEDLAGRSVAVYGPSGTSFVLGQHLAEVGDVTLILEADNRRLLRMLEAGRFGEQGVAVVNQDVAWHLIDQEGHSDIHEAGELQPVSYAIGLSRAAVSEAEFERFNDALEALIADGSVAAILRHHGLEPAF
ncbi:MULTISPECIES: ABC transporter substrate-binding protein [Stutzerimonas stutzeri subgroup]|uniref:substrate-binding periplasmic protein n=1 Tax=Stutzerimonas stutzeri subgroup TaxID=578833 RepID=UPI0006279E98|nr:transporter substrate-binding domain-containing protein [Stutzerimonas kunmingensis]KKJ99004.1 amino acid ABC transporter substrate-binding protein [Stutzerimonas stutzeri]MAF86525.1 amino acid ABC transporter substrate-binding protein [Pseudomonas sp.]MAK86673.1 amino acid ABC transporter substrate-binding protein [Pseudomonas sp.]MBD3874354.1 transporter substrate-binding domain-containing protein [Stutzerimonas kunmingensis]HAG79185.1 amino acid ABC transporter substrate-binding protein 